MRAILRKLLVWCGPTILFFAIGEISERVFFHSGLHPLRKDPILNHVWAPSSQFVEGRYADRGIPPYLKKVNSQSFLNDHTIQKEKPPGTYRIAYFGDSFVEGTCQIPDTVPMNVEKNLTVPGKSSVEVINTGTMSYANTIYYLLLKTKLLDLKPDLVVVNVDMTDVFDDSIYRATLSFDGSGDVIACAPGHPAMATHRRTERGLEEMTTLQRAVMISYRYSKLVQLIVDALGQVVRKRDISKAQGITQAFAWCGDKRSPSTQADVEWSLGMLRRLLKLAKANGICVVVTAVPHLGQLQGTWSTQPMADIEAVATSEGVPFFNTIEDFKKRLGATPPEDIYIPADMHFNPKGYRMWADIQLEHLNRIAPWNGTCGK